MDVREIDVQDLDPNNADDYVELLRRMKCELVYFASKLGVWNTADANQILDILSRKCSRKY